jgi:hypothetical protein
MSGGTVSENRQAAMRGAKPGGEPFSELCRKVVLLITEDWFALSHFRPLIALLQEISREVVVVTRSSGRLDEIEALGVRVIDPTIAAPPAIPRGAAPAGPRASEAERPMPCICGHETVILGGLALKLGPPAMWSCTRPGSGCRRHGRAAPLLRRGCA